MTDGGQGVSARDVDRLRQAALLLAERWTCPVEVAVGRMVTIVGAAPPGDASLPAMLRAALRVRARRNARLGVDVFRDPAWDMLVELLAAHHECRPVPVSTLCAASGVPATTALRHVERMVAAGLLLRSGDCGDQRRVLVEIAPDRVAAVEALVDELAGVTLLPGGNGAAPRIVPGPAL